MPRVSNTSILLYLIYASCLSSYLESHRYVQMIQTQELLRRVRSGSDRASPVDIYGSGMMTKRRSDISLPEL